ncbi:hypothetical protein PC123_g4447 [Phytophthora cactorum]|nr:hypothetical protein PC123_g4447 [Phytophthora cactorum]
MRERQEAGLLNFHAKTRKRPWTWVSSDSRSQWGPEAQLKTERCAFSASTWSDIAPGSRSIERAHLTRLSLGFRVGARQTDTSVSMKLLTAPSTRDGEAI